MQIISVKIQKNCMLNICPGARFNNFKAILMQVIVGNVITLKRWSKIFYENIKKNVLLALFFVSLLWCVTPKLMEK